MNERENRPFTSAEAQQLVKSLDDQFRMCQEVRAARLDAMDKAIELAASAMNSRLEGMNEFREALKDQSSKFVTRSELLAVVVGVSTIISAVVMLIMQLIRK